MAEEIKEEKGIKAKTVSLIGKIIGGAIILIGFILKAFDVWNVEVNDLIKKHMVHGHPLDKEDLINELGDIAWYLAEAATALNVDLEEILIKNIEKLKKRFPDGFSTDKSIHRD